MAGDLPHFETTVDVEKWLARVGERQARRLLAEHRATSAADRDDRSGDLLMLVLQHREWRRREIKAKTIIAVVLAVTVAVIIFAIKSTR